MTDAAPQRQPADPTGDRRRRLKIILAIGLFAALAFALTTIYAERKVNDENKRVQRLAPSVTVNGQDILNAAFTSSNKIGAQFGVASARVSIIVGGGGPCITIRSEYITSSRSSAFLVHNGSLIPTDHC